MKYDKHITGRISKEDYKILKESGHKIRDIIEAHNAKYLKTHPNGLLLKIEQLENEIINNNERIGILKKENEEKKKNIQLLHKKIEETVIKIEDRYNPLLIKAIENITTNYDSKIVTFGINEFLNENGSQQFLQLVEVSNKYNIPLEELKNLILKIYNEKKAIKEGTKNV